MAKQSTEMTKPQNTSSSIQKYADYDEADTVAQRDDFESQTGPTIWFKVEDGEKLRVRMIPAPVSDTGEKPPRWRSLRVHRVPMPGAKFPYRVVCPQQWTDRFGNAKPRGPCPVCAEVLKIKRNAEKLENEGKAVKAEAENDRAFELSAQRRCFANVVVRGKEIEGPKLWEFSGGGKKSMEKRLIGILESTDDEGGPGMASVSSKGYDLKVERQGEGKFDTQYTVTPCRPTSLSDDPKQLAELLEAQHSVDRLKQFKILSAEDILRVLNGEEPGGDESEEQPKRRGGSRAAAPAAPPSGDTIDADIEVEI